MILGEKTNQNRCGERLQMATARKTDKNRFRRRLRTHFFVTGLVFCRFWVPCRTPKLTKNCPGAIIRFFLLHFSDFLVFCSLGRVPGASRLDSGGSADPPGPDFERISRHFLLVLSGSCRGLSGSAGMLPGSAPNLCNPLAVVPLGYGDSRSVLNNLKRC